MVEESPPNIRTYRDLVAWQIGMDLAEVTYRITDSFTKDERFGLVSQMRRAAVSIPANIAEGFGRARNTEFRRFLEIARGSLFEMQTQAELARRLGWITGDPLKQFRDVTHRLDAVLGGLLHSVKARKE